MSPPKRKRRSNSGSKSASSALPFKLNNSLTSLTASEALHGNIDSTHDTVDDLTGNSTTSLDTISRNIVIDSVDDSLDTFVTDPEEDLAYDLPSAPTVSCDTGPVLSSTILEIEVLRKAMKKLELEKERLLLHPFGFFSLKGDSDCLFYTGIQMDTFKLLEETCQEVWEYVPKYDGRNVKKLPARDQLLVTLMKLRLNLEYFDLAKRFGVSCATIYRIFRTWLVALHFVVFQTILNKVPSRNKTKESLPTCFTNFESCRMVLDCTEIRCQVPDKMTEQKITYSSYKKYNTMKVLIGVAPNGAVVFCSSCYGGSVSDKEIVRNSGVLEKFDAGDLILADKGFLITDLLPTGVSVNIPSFLSGKQQFTPSEVVRTRNIARARIHVERFNIRLKNYSILDLIPRSTFKLATMIVQTCAGLVNLQNPLIRELDWDSNLDLP